MMVHLVKTSLLRTAEKNNNFITPVPYPDMKINFLK